MEGKRFIHRLKLKNLLSFGPEGVDIELEPLNVLIGPNASGKSNFIEAISLLRAAPNDIAKPISDGGGISEWLWKGPGAVGVAEVGAVVGGRKAGEALSHAVSVTPSGYATSLAGESISNASDAKDVRYRWEAGDPHGAIHYHTPAEGKVGAAACITVGGQIWLSLRDIDPLRSILAQRKDPDRFPEITYLGRQYGGIQLYREWTIGRFATPRAPQPADLPADVVLPDASNLALVLNALDNMPELGKPVIEELRRFYPCADRLTFFVMGGMIQILLHEEGLETPVRATRLSDGTLHYLFLLAILHQPNPPPLVCIEEPELGLHPDIIPRVAELLVEASSRMQLIVTTHSDILVSALSQTPEAIVVCERDEAGTHLRRLEVEPLKEWIERYALGEAWLEGQIGGTVR